ncbi:MAG: hypothetical protein BAJALOKI2v1_40041 [Promethearchaeota archaeon]|nr:MAG: hypothetical protein BAJALOKI2v1_40041 [Candidatus Lokiarchaeota archaeon]
MEKFIFVLGSNWKLSLAELDKVLQSPRFKGKIVDYSANIAVVEFEKLHKNQYYINKLEELQYFLGGTQKIGKIYDFLNFQILNWAFPTKIEEYNQLKRARKEIIDLLDKKLEEVFPTIEDEPLFFAVSIYPNFFDDDYYRNVLVKHFLPFLNKKISNILKEKGASKAIYFRYPEKNLKSGNLNPIFPHHVIKYELLREDKAELLFGITEEGLYIGRTFTTDDPNFKKKVDEKRPFKEFKSSISPKLAIMMLNFLGLHKNREKKRVLDPFCGNGTVLLFAYLEDFQIYGTDIDPEKINHTRRNLEWLSEELNLPPINMLNERIKEMDIRKLSNKFEANYFDGIITEPHLGPYYTTEPYYNQVREKIEEELTPMYNTIFEESYKILKPQRRIAIVSPSISVLDAEKDLRINIEKIAQANNFKVIPLLSSRRIANKSDRRLQFRKKTLNSLLEAKESQIIKRKIYCFEKEGN